MRPVVETIAGREVALRLNLDALDEIAAVNPQFAEMLFAFETRVWDWREVRAILSAALRPHNIRLEAVYDERGVDGCRALAHKLFQAAMPRADAGNGNAAAEGGETPPSA